MFADDVQIEKSFSPTDAAKSLEDINSDLLSIHNWSVDNGLCLNIAKCQHVIIGSQQLTTKYPICNLAHYNSVVINGIKLRTCGSVKNLGVTFDQHLTWELHINNKCRAALQRLRYLCKFKNFLSMHTKKKLVSTLVIPLLDYCDTVYINASNSLLTKIQKVQNACIRFIFSLKKFDHISDYIKRIKWLSMDKRRFLHSLLIVYKTLRYKEPSYLFNLFDSALPGHMYATRLSCGNTLITPRCRTTKYQKSFTCQSIQLWNKLPEAIKTSPSVNAFKVQVFNNLL